MTDKKGFKGYNLSDSIMDALNLLGYHQPTQIQEEAIPAILKGRDVVCKSQTGSGKTAAFAIPLCEKADWEENAPGALVLEPTRELAVQVREEIFHIGRKRKIKVPVVFGGMPIDKQVQSLRQKAHIVVGTPGRVLDHLRRDTLNLSNVKYLVIDEADLMLDMGFLEDVEQIIKAIRPRPAILLFSATLGEHLRGLIDQYMKEPAYFVIEKETETVEEIVQQVYEVGDGDKFQLLMDILTVENPDSSMIFCGTREMVNALYHQLRRKGVVCGMVHGAMEQRERLQAIEDFRNGKFRHLVTTDVAARGIDFDKLSHVINYDFPTNKENYVHRIGRTGRIGESGKAISLIQEEEKRYLSYVEAYTGAGITLCEAPSIEQVREGKDAFFQRQKKQQAAKKRKGAVLNRSITKLAIGGGRRSKMRAGDVVGAICSIDGITQEDIGIIDVRDSMVLVEIFNGKGSHVLEELEKKTIKGKVRKIRKM